MTNTEATNTGWDEHRADQIRRTASATPLQRLRWLEEAITFASRAGALTVKPAKDPRVS